MGTAAESGDEITRKVDSLFGGPFARIAGILISTLQFPEIVRFLPLPFSRPRFTDVKLSPVQFHSPSARANFPS